MSKKPISFGELDFRIATSMDEPQGVPDPETPFRILIMGDFSGRASRGLFKTGSELVGRRPLMVDRDNVEEVLARLGATVQLPLTVNTSTIQLQFQELDDFHPDQIYQKVELFDELRQTRRELLNPETFSSAAAKVRDWVGTEASAEPGEPHPEPPVAVPEVEASTTGSLLDQILDDTEGQQPIPRPPAEPSGLKAFLKDIVKPHMVPREDPRQEELVGVVDDSTAELMRTILHHPDFQAVEAAWSAVNFLVRRLETDVKLKLYLFDMSKGELAADLAATEDLRSTGVYKLLVEQTVETPGGEPWALVAGNFTFDQTLEDAELLGRMAKIARQAGAPLISAAHDHLLGCESLADTPDPDDWRPAADTEGGQAWAVLRKLPEASYLGLALPRFLLRLPYGEETDPIERFDFEEMTADGNHERYLWGNPCFACVYLLGQAFSHYGWNFRPGVIQDIEGLPLHVFREHGEFRTTPCAEALLTERAAEIILDKGFIPLLSLKNQDTVRVARFQSLADPLTPLGGRWS